MNAVEIEEAVSALTEQPFDTAEFPYTFLAAFGNKDATLRKLRSAKPSESTNKSDVGGVLQRNHIHLAVAPAGDVSATLAALRASPATAKYKIRFILATDGATIEAEDLESGEPLACDWAELPYRFGFFLPLAGITPVRQIRENAFDIRATSKLNKLYVELLKQNPEWGSDERRPDMNHFMARLIFSFFAEDTGIMAERGMFTATVSQMSAPDSSNTHEVIAAVFMAMNTSLAARGTAGLPRWAISFPYVNGGLFAGTAEVPRFSRTARAYLLQVGALDWKQINPDIFGSMIQAVADDEERGALGMHYTSVPNILKVLNPLFLDDLRAKLEEAGDNARTLLNLRKRLARIRVFDPACGSGNFLVIAYKEMRKIEHEVNRRRGETERRSDIPLTNFRGIELRDFAAEIARLALIIAEFQCDELYRGQQEAIRDFLPLSAENWITCGNALRLDWLSVCPPTGMLVKLVGDDLFSTPLDQSEIDFDNAGGETYICGNPPYLGSKWQSAEQKADLGSAFNNRVSGWKSLDYVAGWFAKACDYGQHAEASTAFVSTNSICQGQQVAIMWPMVFRSGHVIAFAHTSFTWTNLASHNAGVTVVIVGLARTVRRPKMLFSTSESGETVVREVANINAYLVGADNVEVLPRNAPPDQRAKMQFGNHPYYGGALIFSPSEASNMASSDPRVTKFIRPLYGAKEFIDARPRKCLWIHDEDADEASQSPAIRERMEAVVHARLSAAQDKAAVGLAKTPYRFRDQYEAQSHVIVVPRVSSENRPQLPVGLLPAGAVIQDQAFALYDAPVWTIALIASRVHLVWIATVCGKMKTDFRYSNSLGWNTFPVPVLTERNRADLTRCAEDVLLAREAHYPASIAELYDTATMPPDLRDAHERNDEIVERIYIGRRFRNDTERLEKLFAMYTQMTAAEVRAGVSRGSRT
jgi:hypothetical protein